MLYQKIELPRFLMRRHLSIWPLNISSPTITEMSSSSEKLAGDFLDCRRRELSSGVQGHAHP